MSPLAFTAPDIGRDALGVLGLAVEFAAIFGGAELLRRRAGMAPEHTRRLVHVLAGLGILLVPRVLSSVWTVLGLGAVFALVLGVTKARGVLQAVHGVARVSVGAVVYPLAMTLLIALSGGVGPAFVVPLIVVVLGDAAAAVVGTRFGRHRYTVHGQGRSVEGSGALAAITFVAGLAGFVHAGLPPGVAVGAALVLTAVLTATEALATGGWDNLALPLVGFLVVHGLTHDAGLTGETIGAHLLALAAAVVVVSVLAALRLALRTGPRLSLTAPLTIAAGVQLAALLLRHGSSLAALVPSGATP